MKAINFLIAVAILLSSCKKEDEIAPSADATNAASSARFADPSNSVTSASTIVVDSVIPLGTNSPEWIEYANSARYLALDTDQTYGVVDWSYPVLLKTYKVGGNPTPYRQISYRLYESMVMHNDMPLYRQLIVHAVFNRDSVVKDYAIVVEHFNCLFDLFETYAYYRDDVPFYGDHTYLTTTGDTLDQYVFWSDTLKFKTFAPQSIGFYNAQIDWADMNLYMDKLHKGLAPIKLWIPVAAGQYHAKPPRNGAYHWYAFIDHIYTPLVNYQLVDVEGAIIMSFY